MKPAQAILIQQATIAEAIALLQAKLDQMTDAFDSDDLGSIEAECDATWQDVSMFAHVNDAALEVISRLKDSELD